MNMADAASFFTITEVIQSQTGHEVKVRLNPGHPVYEGHFPGNPVAPGVMLTDMVRRVAEHLLGRPVRLTSARQIKFLNVVDPGKVIELNLSTKITPGEQGHALVCSATSEGTTYFKIIGELN